MGYLTTITFYNDAADTFQKHPEQVMEGIHEAQMGIQLNRGRDYFCVGSHANPVILQKPRHADDHTLYLHAGNTVVDVYNADSKWAIDTFISEMEYQLKRLKELKKAKKMTIDEKIQELRKITDNFLFIEYYTHTHCDMYKILNEYTRFASDKLVLCPVTEGFEKALDYAIEHIGIRKEKFNDND